MVATANWKDIVEKTGVVNIDGGITGIVVRMVDGATEDLILCDPADADRRAAEAGRSTGNRTRQAERIFMARALRRPPNTATAILVRAVIGRWIHQRGDRHVRNEHERSAVEIIERHLHSEGLSPEGDITAGRMQVAPSCIRTPTAHLDVADVIAKAMEQIRKQIDGRTAIVVG